ncbi:hypothetical protein DYB37_000934 [Aphanomyces astaci]|uniref:Uncharacterized protein n=1 Tax=Aphanomyces astaci TaxID=112090 RepID=A0A3R7C3S9_APHAT|nr:hypothetical protein DYB35_000512 [Aphanomyces astaci]RHZ13808.1 hypothetical protein DYB37_000934 [Aphanomyces astaci]
MASKQADKFVTLLSDKLKQLTSIALTQEELNDKLGTAIATLPNGSLKATLQRNLDVYSKRLGRLIEASLSAHRPASVSEKLLCEADYDILLSQNHTSKLVEHLSVPPSVFANFVTADTSTDDDPVKIVDAIVQLVSAATQELATNGFTSVYSTKQSPHAAIALYADKVSAHVRSWMEAAHTHNDSFDVLNSRQLQRALAELLKVVEFAQLQDLYQAPSSTVRDQSFSFYLPNEVTTSISQTCTSALATLYATYLVLVVHYPSRTPPPDAVDSYDDDDDDLHETIHPVKADPLSVASQSVAELLVTAERFASSWLVDVLLAAAQLPQPTVPSNEVALIAQFNRVVVKALHQLSFQPNMSAVEFVRGVLFVRQAKALLRRTRQANAPQLTSVITRLTSLAIPFKLTDWMTLVAQGK